MRKILNIAVAVITIILLLKGPELGAIVGVKQVYVYVFYFTIAIPAVIYELTQVLKDDRKNNTNNFKKIAIRLIIVALILLIGIIYTNWYYHP